MLVLPRGSFIRKEKEVGDVAAESGTQDLGWGVTSNEDSFYACVSSAKAKLVELCIKGEPAVTCLRNVLALTAGWPGPHGCLLG